MSSLQECRHFHIFSDNFRYFPGYQYPWAEFIETTITKWNEGLVLTSVEWMFPRRPNSAQVGFLFFYGVLAKIFSTEC